MMNKALKLLILVGSPRSTGNSATLAAAVQRGAEAAGTKVSLRFIDDFITSFLRDCTLAAFLIGNVQSMINFGRC
jgi:multimeric flavodoxin WrbA